MSEYLSRPAPAPCCGHRPGCPVWRKQRSNMTAIRLIMRRDGHQGVSIPRLWLDRPLLARPHQLPYIAPPRTSLRNTTKGTFARSQLIIA
jgi:hypothetical protein